jgi:hypothetical protein
LKIAGLIRFAAAEKSSINRFGHEQSDDLTANDQLTSLRVDFNQISSDVAWKFTKMSHGI